MQLDKDFIKAVSRPIWATWNYVAPDADCEGDNDVAIEICIDADRLTFLAQGSEELAEGQRADKLIDEAIKEHGYDAVLKFLSQNIQLV